MDLFIYFKNVTVSNKISVSSVESLYLRACCNIVENKSIELNIKHKLEYDYNFAKGKALATRCLFGQKTIQF